MPLTRRSFLARSAAAAALLPGVRTAGAAPQPPMAYNTGSTICVFSKHLQWLDYRGMAELAAEVGFDGVDLTVRPGGHVLPERVADDLPRAVEAIKAAGLSAPMMTTAITSASDPATERILKTARALGIRRYRMGWVSYRPELGVAKSLDYYRPVMRDLAQLNAQYGLHGGYQNHAGTRVGGPVWDIWMLVKDLDPRWIGCQYDIRHAVVEGGTSWPVALRALAPHVGTIAIKDFHWDKTTAGKWAIRDVPLGGGMVPFADYLALVKELGIGAPISMHFEYAPFEGVKPPPSEAERRKQEPPLLRKDLAALRAMLKGAGLAG